METAESSTSEPPADVDLDDLTQALFRSGRWEDAASLLPGRESDEAAAWHALLLLAVGRIAEPRAILTELGPDTAKVSFIEFLYAADAVLHGDLAQLPVLISRAEELPRHPAIVAVAMRAALSAERRDLATFYAEILAAKVPADAAAAATIAVDRVRHGDYRAAVKAIELSESLRCNDEASALEATLFELRGAQPHAQALTAVGNHLHRENDPTLAPTDDEIAARRRWRAVHARYRPGNRKYLAALTVAVLAGLGAALLLGMPQLATLAVIAVIVLFRTRPIPGLDARTSMFVRSIQDPFQFLRSRRYRPIDAATFVVASISAGGLASYLPRPFPWVGPALAATVMVVAAAVTRGRRRWARKRNEGLKAPAFDLDTCRCLSIESLRGVDSVNYADRHLFRVGAVAKRPDWAVLQCFDTNERFLELPKAALLLRV